MAEQPRLTKRKRTPKVEWFPLGDGRPTVKVTRCRDGFHASVYATDWPGRERGESAAAGDIAGRSVLGTYATPAEAVDAARAYVAMQDEDRLCTPADIDRARRDRRRRTES